MAINSIQFLISPSVTATNGSRIINVTGAVDCSGVYSGTSIFLEGRQVVEGVSGTVPDGSGNSTITLRFEWSQPTITTNMVGFNTIEGLSEATRRIREIINNLDETDITIQQQLIDVQTNIDLIVNAPIFAAATAADRVQTGLDVVSTNSDAAATAADRVQTGLDRTNSETASNIALASSNFKGDWSLLTGAANIPFSSYHVDNIWMLINNVVDVTLSEPGNTSDWVSIATTTGVAPNSLKLGGITLDGWMQIVNNPIAASISKTNPIASTIYKNILLKKRLETI